MSVLSVRKENIVQASNKRQNGKSSSGRFTETLLLSPHNNSVINFSLRDYSCESRCISSGNKNKNELSTKSKLNIEKVIEKLESLLLNINQERKHHRDKSVKLRFVAFCIVPATVHITQILDAVELQDMEHQRFIRSKLLFLFDLLVEFIWADTIRKLCNQLVLKSYLKKIDYQVKYLPYNKELGDALQVEIINEWKKMNHFSPALLASLKFIVIGNTREENELAYQTELTKIVLGTLLIEVKHCYIKFLRLLSKSSQLNKQFDRGSFFLILEWLVKGTVQCNAGESIVGLSPVILDWIECCERDICGESLKSKIHSWATKLSSILLECKVKDDIRAKQVYSTDQDGLQTDLMFNKYEIAHLFLDQLIQYTASNTSRHTISKEATGIPDERKETPGWMSIFRDGYQSVDCITEDGISSLTAPSEIAEQGKRVRFRKWINRHKIKIYQKLKEAFSILRK
ncbi:hypothetical protein RNJ44_00757 [Nakaseomyces bracarensis]|uniref:Uncharacterized protein n=1 Tax=Nakaseomyces bracarensis TaxID=273131 RepID=A0ABR4NS86_9SACH